MHARVIYATVGRFGAVGLVGYGGSIEYGGTLIMYIEIEYWRREGVLRELRELEERTEQKQENIQCHINTLLTSGSHNIEIENRLEICLWTQSCVSEHPTGETQEVSTSRI